MNAAVHTSFAQGRTLRPSVKVLPEHARHHNRALVLQTLYRTGRLSRADIARETGLTRVTVSDLVNDLISENLIVERGQREDARPGKPATMLDIDRSAFQIIGIDLSEQAVFTGAVLDLDGRVLERAEVPLAGSAGEEAVAKVIELTGILIEMSTAPILGIGIGSPGVVDLDGVVLSAPNLGWKVVDLRSRLAERFNYAIVVANDANAAALAEHSFGAAEGDLMVVKVGHGVGAGLLLGGSPLFGSRFAAGEIGHVVVGTDGGALCVCGKHGCLETWLSTPNLEAAIARAAAAGADAGAAAGSGDAGGDRDARGGDAGGDRDARGGDAGGVPDARLHADGDADARVDAVLREAGQRLGIALAPIVGALNLPEVVLSGPAGLLDGTLAQATLETLRNRTMAEFHGDLTLRMTALGQDIVLRGAAAMVLSGQLGVS